MIGFTSFAGAGKNFYGKLLETYLWEESVDIGVEFSFALELRKEVDDFLQKQTGISAFTEDRDEKKIIRPFLVFWGTHFRRAQDPDYWVKKLEKTIDAGVYDLPIITDVRYKNEVEWIQGRGGVVISIDRDGIEAPNKEEGEEYPIVKAIAKYHFYPKNLSSTHEIGYITGEFRDYIKGILGNEGR